MKEKAFDWIEQRTVGMIPCVPMTSNALATALEIDRYSAEQLVKQYQAERMPNLRADEVNLW